MTMFNSKLFHITSEGLLEAPPPMQHPQPPRKTATPRKSQGAQATMPCGSESPSLAMEVPGDQLGRCLAMSMTG